MNEYIAVSLISAVGIIMFYFISRVLIKIMINTVKYSNMKNEVGK